MRHLISSEKLSRGWNLIGVFSILVPFLALTFYSVIASWSLDYFSAAAFGRFSGIDAGRSTEAFQTLLASPLRMFFWHSLFMLITTAIVALGVKRGLERAVNIMIPSLLAILIFLAGFAAIEGDFSRAFHFMFYPDFSQLTLGVIFLALGQAFFSLSVGGGYLMTYSAYLPENVSLPQASVSIALIDLLIALLAGLAIFPIVFAFGLDVNSGPGLMFETLPVAFGNMSAGIIVGHYSFYYFLSLHLQAPLVCWSRLCPGWKNVRACPG
ncbi:MAG: hypothetical protein GKR93_02560 [Gammaproteobacteria bacterium]|nr:hypothetical protein [Gammaproteobacteria bacterium]